MADLLHRIKIFVFALREETPDYLLLRSGGFDGTTFHRIIPRGIVQGGDPLSKNPKQASQYGTGGLGLLKAEFSDRPMARGVVAAVRRPKDPNSAGQQFFVVLSDQPSLTGQFTIFGEVVEGMDVANKLFRAEFADQGALSAPGGLEAFKKMFPQADFIKKAYVKK